MQRITVLSCLVFAIASSLSLTSAFGDPPESIEDLYGRLRLIDEVIPGKETPAHKFAESPAGVSEVREILSRPTRVIPNEGEDARYIYYRLGAGKNLKAGKAYVLQVDYPEDAPRTMFILNRGSETARGLHTGNTVGDVLQGRYTDSNLESLKYPLSGKHETFHSLFYLQDTFPDVKAPRGANHPRSLKPADGIPIIIAQWKSQSAPLSHGSAVSRIALYEVLNPSALDLKINYPPNNLPRRHLFWREEMADGVVGKEDPGWKVDTDWYQAKAELMQFLGMNTFTIDMLEFGHNQGWDSAPGGRDWVNESHAPKRWENVLKMLKAGRYDFTVLPYYEYAGSVGANSPGTKRFARPLGDQQAYTHITWSEKAYADVTEPIITEDAKKVLDLTITRWKNLMPFTGAWFRVRPSHIPVSFSDNALAKFSRDRKLDKPVTREQLRDRGELYQQYILWWNDQRKAFFVALRDHLRAKVNKDALIMFTADVTEGGKSLRGPGGRKVVTDDVELWDKLIAERGFKLKALDIKEVVEKDMHLEALLAPTPTWGQWEWEHSAPGPDPANYKDTDGIINTYSFNRIYTVASPTALDAFRGPSGLGIVRHYNLNEHEIDDKDLGYFMLDIERAGPYMMLAEVIAVANGDPWYIGYLSGHQFNRGFPEYARRFNRAYLALPALPSEILADASSDKDVVVRVIRTPSSGTYLAICNTAMTPKPGVTIKLPVTGRVTDAAVNKPLQATDGELKLDMDTAELRAIRIQ